MRKLQPPMQNKPAKNIPSLPRSSTLHLLRYTMPQDKGFPISLYPFAEYYTGNPQMGQEKHRHPMQFLLYKKVPPVSAEIHGTFPFSCITPMYKGKYASLYIDAAITFLYSFRRSGRWPHCSSDCALLHNQCRSVLRDMPGSPHSKRASYRPAPKPSAHIRADPG